MEIGMLYISLLKPVGLVILFFNFIVIPLMISVVLMDWVFGLVMARKQKAELE